MTGFYTVGLCLLIAASGLEAQSPTAPWRATGPRTGEYLVSSDSAVSHGGRRSARIEALLATPTAAASVTQGIRADKYRGKRVRLSAWIQTRDAIGPGATINIGVGIGGLMPVQASNITSPARGTAEWRRVFVEVDVHQSALGLYLGGTLQGGGIAWFDDYSLEIIGEATPAAASTSVPAGSQAQVKAMSDFFAKESDQPRDADFESESITTTNIRSALEAPRALAGRGLENVSAFARLVGVVRHFHPVELVRTTNWDDFIIRGVRAVEHAPNADSLAKTLTPLFAAIAPQVHIAVGPPKPTPVSRPDLGNKLGIAYWANTGIVLSALASNNIYSSSLAVSPAPDGNIPFGVPTPDSTWNASLPGGVSAVVPIAMWVEAANEPRRQVQPSPAQVAASPNDRATRIAGVIELWNVFQHSYPYFDLVKVDWSAELQRALTSAAADRTPADYLGTLQRLVAAARDGHGNVYGFSGYTPRGFLPVSLDWVEGQLVVTHVGPTAPPDIKRGDVIEAIDGVKASDVLAAREERISGATPQWRRFRAVSDVALGDTGTVVALRLRSGRTVSLPYTLRAAVILPTPDKITEIRPGIYYVDIGRITDADLSAALPRLALAKGVVFDMRGYPRAVNTTNILARLSGDTIRSAHFETPTYSRPDQEAPQWRDGAWVLAPREPRISGKIAFLTGGGAISYAESTMGIVEQYKLGEIVGATTAGTNGNVNPFVLPGGYQVAFTGMRVRKRDDSPHHGVGIRPTIPVARTIRGVTDGRDEALERAIIAVGGSAASAVPFD